MEKLSTAATAPVKTNDGMAAYKRGDYVAALLEVRPLAERGDPQAQCLLGAMYELARGLPQNHVEARRWYGLAAGQGDAEAAFKLGLMHHNGRGGPKDYAEALRLYTLAAGQGHAPAHHTIGLMYYKGHGVAQDQAEALRRFRLAADGGDSGAQYILGALYANGQGVEQSIAEALRWFRLAAEQGDAEAQYALAWILESSQSATPATAAKSLAEAARLYGLAAERGHVLAQVNLGLMHATGRGAPQDFAAALRLFRLAAEKGNAAAQANLGLLFANGQGVPQDPAEAVRWFRFAAEQGDSGALNNLGVMLRDGRGVAVDDGEALRCFKRAAEQGYAAAQHNLGLMCHEGRGVAQDTAEALRWYRRAAAQGSAPAQYNLGLAYEHGDGVVLDFPEAIKWYRLAAEQGYAKAQVNLGMMCREGQGVDKNVDEAVRWFTRAAEQGDTTAWHNLGVQNLRSAKPREAIACYEQVLAIDPTHAKARSDRGIVSLGLGDFERGWTDYEARLETEGHRDLPGRRWRGEDLRGKTLFVHAEQGFGDAFQFVRFLPRLKDLGARVVLECHPGLFRLFQTAPGVDALVRIGDPLPEYDYYCPLCSLPLMLKLFSESDFAVEFPYLRSPPRAEASAADAKVLAAIDAALSQAGSNLKVGIVWAGHVSHALNRLRTTTLETFLPLTEVPGVKIFSVQVGGAAEQLSTLGAGKGIIELGSLVRDFADTAAALERLDLMIGIDTGVSHLSAALGRPTWVVLPFIPDFRWQWDREDCPWYPSVRLFRMKYLDEWPGVIGRVAEALGRLASKKSAS